MGDLSCAVCFGESEDDDYIVRVAFPEKRVRQVAQLQPMDNVHLMLECAFRPVILERAPAEKVLKALFREAGRHALHFPILVALDRKRSEELRRHALQEAQNLWSKSRAATSFSRLLLDNRLQNCDVSGTLALTDPHQRPELVQFLQDLKEILPFEEPVRNIFLTTMKSQLPATISRALLDKGLVERSVIGAARQDFTPLNHLVARLGEDPAFRNYADTLTNFVSQVQAIPSLPQQGPLPKPQTLTS